MSGLSERGAVSTEFAAVMTAFLTAFMLLIVFAGRVAQAENDVRSAAQGAARAASLAGTPTQADAEARRVAEANLTTSGLSSSQGLDVAVGRGKSQPGGWVSVTITAAPRSPTSRASASPVAAASPAPPPR